LEAIRDTDPGIRFCQASSSELFGEPTCSPQSEETPFRPRSPYGAAKLYAHTMVGVYRRRYGVFACSAILFNHESPRRGPGFVTRKVTAGAAAIKLGQAQDLKLGALDARRDWGFAADYVRGAWSALQAAEPDDYVLATGETHSVRELCEIAFAHVGLDYRRYVREDPSSSRPIEATPLVGDASRAAERLGWSPSVSFAELVRTMVDADLERLKSGAGETEHA
jgi:GDPmannose 4,6-dehydratase